MPKVSMNSKNWLLMFVCIGLCMALILVSWSFRTTEDKLRDELASKQQEIETLEAEKMDLEIDLLVSEAERYKVLDSIDLLKSELMDLELERYYIESNSSVDEFIEFKKAIDTYIFDLCKIYTNVDPYIVMSIVQNESRYNPDAENGTCVGLTQLSTKWFTDRANNLGVEDLKNPYGNVLVCVWYLNELLKTNTLEDSLYIYNHSTVYVNNIIFTADLMRNGGG